MKSTKFIVADADKCIGCKICEVACHAAHDNLNYTVGAQYSAITPRLHVMQVNGKYVPVQCRQCEDAPCANACAIGAITEVAGKIIINEKTCIGCKACLVACPFGAIDLRPQIHNGEVVTQPRLKTLQDADENKSVLVAYKCDLCAENETQACVAACPENALRVYNALDDSKAKALQSALALHAI